MAQNIRKVYLVPILGLLILFVVLIWVLNRHQEDRILVGIGIDLPLIYGAAINPSDKHTADLFLQTHPDSRIAILEVFNDLDPERARADLEAAIARGARFFVLTLASSHAVKVMDLFADGQILAIDVASTTLKLADKDDYLFRIVPNLRQEQTAMARQLETHPGRRLLVLQDAGNLAYTDPAFEVFAEELARSGRWDITRRAFQVSAYDPAQIQDLMDESFDALYILAGAFLPPIGNIAQLFHYHFPEAPILLTPWARAPGVIEHAGDAIDQLQLLSFYPALDQDPALAEFYRRFNARFDYNPWGMSIGTWQALELFNQAFAAGHETPDAVKAFLMSQDTFQTGLGIIRFDAEGDLAEASAGYRLIEDLREELQ